MRGTPKLGMWGGRGPGLNFWIGIFEQREIHGELVGPLLGILDPKSEDLGSEFEFRLSP